MDMPPRGSQGDGDGQQEADHFAQQQAIGELESQVATAQAELEEYQRLLNDLPGIYEDKFRQKVRSVAQELRHLLDERKALQRQVSQALSQAPEAPSLPPAPELEERTAPPKRWADVRLPRFSPPSTVLPSFPPPRRRMLLFGLGGGLALSLVLVGLLTLVSRRTTPASNKPAAPVALPSKPSSTGRLKLQASGGQSWVLVEDLKGGKVFDAILEPGQSQVLPIGAGLRLRSGRPDLLLVGVGQQPPKPLGGVGDLDWVEVLPPSR